MTTYVYRIHDFCRKFQIGNSTFYREVQLGRLRTIRCKGKQFITEQEAERWHSQRKIRRAPDPSTKSKKQPDPLRRTSLVGGFLKRLLGK